jgi:hypothetical protein
MCHVKQEVYDIIIVIIITNNHILTLIVFQEVTIKEMEVETTEASKFMTFPLIFNKAYDFVVYVNICRALNLN